MIRIFNRIFRWNIEWRIGYIRRTKKIILNELIRVCVRVCVCVGDSQSRESYF